MTAISPRSQLIPPLGYDLRTRRQQAISVPDSQTNIASNSVYIISRRVPSDVTRIRFRIADRDVLGSLANGAAIASQKIAVGTPNAALTDWASTPSLQTGITLPIYGDFFETDWFPVTPNAAGYIMIAYTVAAGATRAVEALQPALVVSGSTDPTTLTGAVASTDQAYCILAEYESAAAPLVILGDSISRGAGSGAAGINDGWHNLVPGYGYDVLPNACSGITLASFVTTTNIFLRDLWESSVRDATVIMALGYNDFAAGTSAATCAANIGSLYQQVLGLGARRCIFATVSTSSVLTAPQQAQRQAYNNWVLGKPDRIDIDGLTRDPNSTLVLLYPAADGIHWAAPTYSALVMPYVPDINARIYP